MIARSASPPHSTALMHGRNDRGWTPGRPHCRTAEPIDRGRDIDRLPSRNAMTASRRPNPGPRPVLGALLLSSLFASGCILGPKYQRPDMAAPPAHRGAAAETGSLADIPWWDLFEDPALQALVREALANNHDLRIAAARVEEVRALAGIPKSFLYPEVNVGGNYTVGQLSRLSDPPQAAPEGDRRYQNWNAGFALSWEIDVFGRIRRESEAAFARFRATEEFQRGVIVTLVADVASGYFALRSLDLQLEIARRTVATNDESVDFYRKRVTGGVSNRLELDQAVANRARTATTIPDLERQIAITENALSVLLGRPPGPIARGAALSDQYVPPRVPPGLPAALLERRPDVVASEQNLVAANADIGAAKALFYPTISLTGLLGGASRDLSDLIKGDAAVWSVTPGLFQPLFQAGRIRRNYEAAEARFEQALAAYQQTALTAYREVADALVTIEKLAEARREEETGVEALRDAGVLARSRYDTGLSNYLEVLLADQYLFERELVLARIRGEELTALTRLYRALGGGWRSEPSSAPAPAVDPQ